MYIDFFVLICHDTVLIIICNSENHLRNVIITLTVEQNDHFCAFLTHNVARCFAYVDCNNTVQCLKIIVAIDNRRKCINEYVYNHGIL